MTFFIDILTPQRPIRLLPPSSGTRSNFRQPSAEVEVDVGPTSSHSPLEIVTEQRINPRTNCARSNEHEEDDHMSGDFALGANTDTTTKKNDLVYENTVVTAPTHSEESDENMEDIQSSEGCTGPDVSPPMECLILAVFISDLIEK
jgi:hypothetical protein